MAGKPPPIMSNQSTNKTPDAPLLPFMEQATTERLSVIDYVDLDRRSVNPTGWDVAKPSLPEFDGREGYDESLDADRLRGQLKTVYDIMSDGKARTLQEILALVGHGSETGISTRLRDLRKKKFGGHTVNKRRRGNERRGLWEYWIEE